MAAKQTRAIILPLGTRVKHMTGREGEVVRYIGRHSGYLVRWDKVEHSFERNPAKVLASSITPTEPKLHERFESLWPPFVQRDRAKWATLKEEA